MKKFICFVLTLVFSFSLWSAASAKSVIYGDVNGDGKINARDVIAMMRYIVDNNTQIDVQAADVMKSSGVELFINSRDVIVLMKYITGADFVLGKDVPTSVPPASDFSDEKFEARLNPIVRIKSATLYKNGTVTKFAPDDPKIIRLINFISYPDSDMCLNAELMGMYNDEDMDKIWNRDFRMEIEVDNPNEYGNHMFDFNVSSLQFDKLVISGNEVVQYSNERADSVWGSGYSHYTWGYCPYEALGYINILEWCGF